MNDKNKQDDKQSGDEQEQERKSLLEALREIGDIAIRAIQKDKEKDDK